MLSRCRNIAVFTLVLLGLLVARPAALDASPASPHPISHRQPDGNVITIYIRGGEHFHWYEDANQYTIMESNGAFFYARLDDRGQLTATNLLVGRADPAQAGLTKRILPAPEHRHSLLGGHDHEHQHDDIRGGGGPAALIAGGGGAIGTVKNVVIMMRFSDHVGRTLPSQSDMEVLFNNVGPHATLAPTGSVRDVYLENSYGLLTINSTAFGWVTLPNTEAFYAGGASGLGNATFQQSLVDALVGLDPFIDFNQFDDNGDDQVDAIAFIHSGYGAEWGGTDCFGATSANRIWSHRSTMPAWTSAEGVRVGPYHISPGVWGTCGSDIGRVGVIAHETGHFFGLPDLYDTNGGSSGIGSWCMMANSWGFDGSQLHPPSFSAWCKMQLGWVNPVVISPGTYNVPQVNTNQTIYRINHNYPPGEYLLIENRQPIGFENIMPQGGLFVWHIDEGKGGNTDQGFPGQAGWPENNSHYMVALLQADGDYDLERGGGSDAGDPYRSPFATLLSNTTVPNTYRYQDGNVSPTGNTITAISSSSNNMSFTYTRPNFDCNLNGFEDAEDIAGLVSDDCNNDARPDECEIHVTSIAGGGPFFCVSNCDADCNLSGVPDACELAGNDCNGDLRPDECGVLTACEVEGITGDDVDAGSRFGSSLSVFSDLMIVGDETNDTLGIDAGAAYAFKRSGANWINYGPKMVGFDTVAGDAFGCAAGVFSSVAVVGAKNHAHSGFTEAGAVYAFADTGSGWSQYQKVLALDPGTGDRFGASISMDGDTLAVGAPSESGKGAVYIFRRSGGLNWTQEVKIVGWDSVAGDDFGEYVSLRSDTLVVSARGRDEQGSNSGAAYVFFYDGISWTGLQKLQPSNGTTGDRFGRCSVLYPLIACGAPENDALGANSGSAYVFRYDLSSQFYQEETVLTPAGGAAGNRFGSAVATGNGFVAVGSESASPGGISQGGSVTVFQYVQPSWVEFLTVSAADAVAGDQFGASLNPVFVNDRIWAAAPAPSGARFGHVYEYAIGGNDCNCNAAGDSCDIVLGTPDGNGNGIPDECEDLDCNGNGINDATDVTNATSLDCNGNGRPDECEIAALSAAPGGPFFCQENCDADCDESGVPDVCELAANDCNGDTLHDACGIAIGCDDTEAARLEAADPASSDNFGAAVDIRGDVIIAGANWDDCGAGADCGSAYVFRRTGNLWSQEQKLTAADAGANDNFARAVSINGDLAAVGSFADDCGAGADCGAIYVYRRQGGNWVQEQKLTAGDPATADTLGLPVAIEGNMVVAGASGVDCLAGNNCGAVYAFRHNGANWVQDAKLSAADVSANDGFGQALALHGDLLVVGSPNDDCAAGADCGAAYVFRRTGGVWQQEKKLTAFDAGATDNFGAAVTVADGVIAVGAPRDDCGAGADCGALYTFRYVGGTWISETKLAPGDAAANDNFGRALDMTVSLIVASSWLSDCSAGVNCGSMYVFRHNGAAWSEQQELMSASATVNDNFGGVVAVDGAYAVAGVTFDDCFAGSNCGAAYVFALQDADCNCNSIADRCDIAFGTEPDSNANGIPDDCEVSAPQPASPPHDWKKNRYISFNPASGSSSVAFRVDKLTAPTGTCWVGPPDGAGRAKCDAAPTFRVWSESVVHVGDCEIMPVASYEVRGSSDGVAMTPPLLVQTIDLPTAGKFWGDVAGVNAGPTWTPPNQFSNVQDVLAVLSFITNAASKPTFEAVNVSAISSTDSCLNAFVNTADVLQVVRAAAGEAYPFATNPATCPVCP